MNFLQLTEMSVMEQPMLPTYSAPRSLAPHLARHRDPNPTAAVLAIISFVMLSIAIVWLTAHLDLLGIGNSQGPVHRVQLLHVQQ